MLIIVYRYRRPAAALVVAIAVPLVLGSVDVRRNLYTTRLSGTWLDRLGVDVASRGR